MLETALLTISVLNLVGLGLCLFRAGSDRALLRSAQQRVNIQVDALHDQAEANQLRNTEAIESMRTAVAQAKIVAENQANLAKAIEDTNRHLEDLSSAVSMLKGYR